MPGAARSLRAHHIPYGIVNNHYFDRYRKAKVLVLSDVPQFEDGKVDAVLLTGGVVHNEYIVEQLKKRVGFIAPVYVYPGEREMLSLGQQTYYALTGKEEVFEL